MMDRQQILVHVYGKVRPGGQEFVFLLDYDL